MEARAILDDLSSALRHNQHALYQHAPALEHPKLRLQAADQPLAQQLYLRLFEHGGLGTGHVQRLLLALIIRGRQPDVVGFLGQILSLRRRGDRFVAERRQQALDGLCALSRGRTAALARQALRAAIEHDNPAVRADAVAALVASHGEADGGLPAGAVELLSYMAAADPAYLPRLLSREALRAAGLPLPTGEPGRYGFLVTEGAASREVAIEGDETLVALHRKIAQAFGASGKAYAFLMDGGDRTSRYAIGTGAGEIAPRAYRLRQLGLWRGIKFTYHQPDPWRLLVVKLAEVSP